MICILDGDLFVYRVGFTVEEEPEWVGRARINSLVHDILNAYKTQEYRLWLSDSLENTFRYRIWDQYKANRKDLPKPKQYDWLRRVLIDEWGARLTPEQETDDAMGIAQTTYRMQQIPSVICTIDKDLDQIPGLHYNFVNKKEYTISEFEGLRLFYKQLLTGDRTDGVYGIDGVGPKKSEKILASCSNEEEMFAAVLAAYKTWLSKGVEWSEEKQKRMEETILRNGRLLKIRTTEDELWSFPGTRT